jgi:DNA-binding Lrp family transcriptional regulator
MRAYVLIRVRSGEEQSLRRVLEHGPGILRTDTTFGPYDVIAEIRAPDLVEIGRLVTETIRSAPGVLETVTCLVLE